MKKLFLLLMSLPFMLLSQEKNVFYVQWREITPGQMRFASRNVADKAAAAIKSGAAFKDISQSNWQFKYDNGKSIMPEKAALPVIKIKDGYILVDGHHDTLASIQLGAKTIPVYIKEEMSDLDMNQVWDKAEQKVLVYPYNLNRERVIPKRAQFKALQDDPYRYFAALAARKCTQEGQDAKETIGHDYPLWIKVGKDIPFIEFKIADVLYQYGDEQGFDYSYDISDKDLGELIKKAHAVLKAHPVKGLKLVDEINYYEDIPDLCVNSGRQ